MYPADEANSKIFMVCERVKCICIFAMDTEMTGNHGSTRVTLLSRMYQLNVLCVSEKKKDILVLQ